MTSEKELRLLAVQGQCAEQIADVLGMDRGAVGIVAKALGIKLCKKGEYEARIRREEWARMKAEADAVVAAYKEARKSARKAAGDARRADALARKEYREKHGKRLYRKPNYFGVLRRDAPAYHDPFGIAHGKNFRPNPTGAATGAAVVFINEVTHGAT